MVSLDFPEGSLLLLRATGCDHLGGQILSVEDPEYATIQSWIASLPSATCL
jgi:hypothetical protein